jgi:hypothetical protein
VCTPNATDTCYGGPAGTEGVGPCKAGVHTCDAQGTTWGPCMGEVIPKAEDCSTPEDDQCSGAIAPCGATTTWAKQFGDVYEAQDATSLALDDAANAFIAGSFQGTMDFGGGPLTSAGAENLYLASFDPAGAHRWSKSVAAPFLRPTVATDGLGHVIVATSVQGVVDFGGGPVFGSDQVYDGVVVEYDEAGSFVWAKRWSGVSPWAMRVDPRGNVFVIGSFYTATPDLGCGQIAIPSNLGAGVFVVKLSPDGSCAWSKALGGPVNPGAVGVDPSGNVFVGATFLGVADFGGGPVGSNNNSPMHVSLTRLASDGSYQFTKIWLVGQPASATVGGLAVDAAGNVILTGTFGPGGGNPPPESVDFGNGPITTNNYQGAYLVKLDGLGTALWSKALGPAITQGYDVGLDPNGNLVATGNVFGDLHLGNVSIASANGLYVARFDPSGNALSATAFPGGVWSGYVAVDGNGHARVAGGFANTMQFGNTNLTSAGNRDAFLADVVP